MKQFPAKHLFGITLALCALAEALSFAAFYRPTIGLAVLAVITAAALWLTLKDLRYGLLLVVAEIAIGSQGYLFSSGGQGSGVSLRIVLWIIVMAVWLARELLCLMRGAKFRERVALLPYRWPLFALGGVLLIGLIVGVVAGNNGTYFFLEAKRWAYALILLPLLLSFRRRSDAQALLAVAGAGAVWLALKTLFVVYVFSHGIAPFMYSLYDWSRQNLLAEITHSTEGFSRVFMQSQIFLIPALFASLAGASLPSAVQKKRSAFAWAAAVLTAALVASLSRSFWVGGFVATALCAAVIAFVIRPGWKKYMSRSLIAASLVLAGVVLLFAVTRFPFPKPSAGIDADLLRDRATQMEAGAASRWSLLPVMGREIIRSPLWGYGFGKTLTYTTSDPRVTSSTTDGRYTTYAFEWGWLDIALKLGVLGVAAYVWIFIVLLKDAWRSLRHDPVRSIVYGGSLVALGVVHFFTPYLNHPLGFIFIGITMVIFQAQKTDEIEEKGSLPKI